MLLNCFVSACFSVGYDEDYWDSFGYLVAILVVVQLTTLLLMYFPMDRILYLLRTAFFPTKVLAKIASSESRITFLQGQVQYLVNKGLDAKITGNISGLGCDDMSDDDENKDVEKAPLIEHGQEKTRRLTLSWSNITLKLKSNNNVLVDSVSGKVRQGKCLALMGPSGIRPVHICI